MSTISGRYVRTFAEADTAMLDNVSLNAPYPFFWLSIVSVERRLLTCKAASQMSCLKIRAAAAGEWVLVTMHDPVFGPIRYKALPFLSEGGRPSAAPADLFSAVPA